MEHNLRFADLAKLRQSDRKYKEQAVEKDKLIQCLETARISPSANNSQPWKFVVVDDIEKKEQIAECTIGLGMNKFTRQCPVLVAVVLEQQNFMSTIGSMIKNKNYSLFDIGIAVNQFCLQAADLGLGTCIIGWFDEKKIPDVSVNFGKFEPAFRYHGCITDGFIGKAKVQLCSATKMKEVMELIYNRSAGKELLADQKPLEKKLYTNEGYMR